MVFIYPPARLITLPLVPLTALADSLEYCNPALQVAVEQVDTPASTRVPEPVFSTQPQSNNAENLSQHIKKEHSHIWVGLCLEVNLNTSVCKLITRGQMHKNMHPHKSMHMLVTHTQKHVFNAFREEECTLRMCASHAYFRP